jgi:hypothetical protein
MDLFIHRYSSLNDREIISQSYKVSTEILKKWLFKDGANTIIDVPDFQIILEMKKFILAINLLVEPFSGHVKGPIGMFYFENGESKDLGKFTITANLEKMDIRLKKYGFEDIMPESNQKLQTMLEDGNIDHFIAAVTYGGEVFWNYKENPSEAPFSMEEPGEFWRFE